MPLECPLGKSLTTRPSHLRTFLSRLAWYAPFYNRLLKTRFSLTLGMATGPCLEDPFSVLGRGTSLVWPCKPLRRRHKVCNNTRDGVPTLWPVSSTKKVRPRGLLSTSKVLL